MNISPIIEESWKQLLKDEFKKPYLIKLKEFLLSEKKKYTVFPKGKDIFNAFNKTPLSSIKVVILGQDPYHGDEQAHGLAFSVQTNINPPPSLINIFKEIEQDINIKNKKNGNLTEWAQQGVLLLNCILTVRRNMAGSHQNKGWEIFTDQVISLISKNKHGIVFLLWGNYAKEKSKLIDQTKHHILYSSHPSPLSAYKGFLGCKHFSECNRLLRKQNLKEINWQIS